MNLKVISLIAAKELRYIALSPIGWIVLAIFFVQAAYQFTGTLDLLFGRLALGRGPDSFAEALFTSSFRTTFQAVIRDVYLFIPLVTMATFSRELQSGAIKLFMSSPVRPIEIVLGKFLGVAAFLLSFVACLLLFIIIALASIPSFDWAATLPGLIGIYLLVCAYAAIGVFVSSLTRHQVVAAIVTLAILFVLQSMASWLQTVPILNEVTAWASLAGRANTFRSGLIASPDIVYFAVMVALFLAFTVLNVTRLRTRKRMADTAGAVIGTATLAVGAGWILSLPQLSFFVDTTFDKRNSLAPESAEIIERIDGPWSIVTYANFVDNFGVRVQPRRQIADKNRWTFYRQINPQLDMEYVLYYDLDSAADTFPRPDSNEPDEQVINEYARRVGIDPSTVKVGQELDAGIDLDLAAEEFRSLRVIRWNDREVVLRHFRDAQLFAAERTRAAALKSLIDGGVSVGVVQGMGERSVNGMRPADYEHRFTRRSERFSLINHGFEFQNLALSSDVPQNIDVLLIADPTDTYSEEMLSRVQQFIDRGGHLVLLIEPESASSVDLVLSYLGLERGDRVTEQSSDGSTSDFLLATAKPGVLDAYWGEPNLRAPVVIDGAVSLRQKDTDEGFARSAALVFDDKIIGYSLQRVIAGQNQRVLVFGDADLFSTANAERRRPFSNTATAFDAFHWLTGGEYPVKLTRRDPIDNDVRLSRAALTALQWILIGGVPLVILSAGGVLLTRRRRE